MLKLLSNLKCGNLKMTPQNCLEVPATRAARLFVLTRPNKFLRAPDCKYQKSYNRREISDFILFHLNVTFGELFSKNTIKSPVALSFF